MRNKSMKVLIVEPEKEAYFSDIRFTMSNLQNIVGGDFNALYPYDDTVAIICNHDRSLGAKNRDIGGEIVSGKFIVTGLSELGFDSLKGELAKKFYQKFKDPHIFIEHPGKCTGVPIAENALKDIKSQSMKVVCLKNDEWNKVQELRRNERTIIEREAGKVIPLHRAGSESRGGRTVKDSNVGRVREAR